MFHRIFGADKAQAATQAETALTTAPTTAGETETVRRIVARLEAMPADQARFVASAAYTLARAANADMDISDEETDGDRGRAPGARRRSTSRPRCWSPRWPSSRRRPSAAPRTTW